MQPAATASRILRVAPYFPVADVAATTAYYHETLGFAVEYSAGEPPEFAILTRDRGTVMLRRVSDSQAIRPMESQGGSWDAFFWVSDAEGLAAELTSRGASFVYPVTLRPYGTKEFAVRDRDGHVLGFGQEVSVA